MRAMSKPTIVIARSVIDAEHMSNIHNILYNVNGLDGYVTNWGAGGVVYSAKVQVIAIRSRCG